MSLFGLERVQANSTGLARTIPSIYALLRRWIVALWLGLALVFFTVTDAVFIYFFFD